jgi:hypothetical protein
MRLRGKEDPMKFSEDRGRNKKDKTALPIEASRGRSIAACPFLILFGNGNPGLKPKEKIRRRQVENVVKSYHTPGPDMP